MLDNNSKQVKTRKPIWYIDKQELCFAFDYYNNVLPLTSWLLIGPRKWTILDQCLLSFRISGYEIVALQRFRTYITSFFPQSRWITIPEIRNHTDENSFVQVFSFAILHSCWFVSKFVAARSSAAILLDSQSRDTFFSQWLSGLHAKYAQNYAMRI